MHKGYRRRRFNWGRIAAILVISALAVFSFYEYTVAAALSEQNAYQHKQNETLTSQLESLQNQYDSLQNTYKSLKSSTAPSQTPSQTPSPSPSGAGSKVAYLTFDDGPSNQTSRLLTVLQENNVKATFFTAFMGEDTQEKRTMLKAEADAGNTVGVHSFTHNYNQIYANEQAFLDDFNKMKEIVAQATGNEPTLCRFPGGIGNTVSITASGGKELMPTLVQDVENMGVTPFDWNAGGEDAQKPYPTSEKLVQDVLKDAKGHDTVVILLHDTHDFTIDAVPEIIKEFRSQGYTFAALTPQSKPIRQAFAKQ